MDNRPIGIFDSGMGGLTVRAEIARQLPDESLIYFGDGKNVPYGPRTKNEITDFADRASRMLIDKGIKLLVVACNAATGASVAYLRGKYDIPIVGMEPAVKPAAMASKSGVIGVIATAAALNGDLYKSTAAKYGQRVRIIEAVGEGFVEIVENDLEDTPAAFRTVEQIVGPMVDAGADHIVLGCTHYPFLAPQIRRIVGERDVRLTDSAHAIARRTRQLLTEHGLLALDGHIPAHEYCTFADEKYRLKLIDKGARAYLTGGFLEK